MRRKDSKPSQTWMDVVRSFPQTYTRLHIHRSQNALKFSIPCPLYRSETCKLGVFEGGFKNTNWTTEQTQTRKGSIEQLLLFAAPSSLCSLFTLSFLLLTSLLFPYFSNAHSMILLLSLPLALPSSCSPFLLLSLPLALPSSCSSFLLLFFPLALLSSCSSFLLLFFPLFSSRSFPRFDGNKEGRQKTRIQS